MFFQNNFYLNFQLLAIIKDIYCICIFIYAIVLVSQEKRKTLI